jgi:hypothetical protein
VSTTASAAAAPLSIPEPYRLLVDDAAVFPPGSSPLDDAVPAHRRHLRSPYADFVGPFVIDDARLPPLLDILRRDRSEDPLGVAVVVTGGAGAIEPAVQWASRAEEVALDAVEVALRDEADLAYNAGRVVTMLDRLQSDGRLGEDARQYVEPPRLFGADPAHSWLGALDELAAADLRLKFRTGGVDADAFPSARELATCLGAAVDRELRFKCTAGLHHALRHRDAATGFEHHGFLNLIAATRATLDSASVEDVARILEEQSAESVLALLAEAGDAGLVSARRWFTSFGACSVREPLDDLIGLGLLSQEAA